MHVHLPKPLHGWREFMGEVGIIVLGVLIALSAEQLVEIVHWRQQVREARATLGTELADSMGQAYERQRISSCIERRLDQISTIVDDAAASGRLPPFGDIGNPPYRTWLSSNWQTTIAGQTATHFDRHQLEVLGSAYEFVNILKSISERELTTWSRLQSIVGPGRKFDAGEAAAMRNEISEARLLHRLTLVSGIRIRQLVVSEAIPYSRTIFEQYRARDVRRYPICHSIGTHPPLHYGVGPMETSVARALEEPLTIPR